MLQAVYHLSQIYPLQYWSAILALLLVVIAGWYVQGTNAGHRVVVPIRLGWKFTPAGRSLIFTVANLVVVGQIVSSEDTIGASIALQVT